MKLPRQIAIDGPAASGKSTIGERLAHQLGYLYFDTGIMYRAVTLAALEQIGGVDDEQAVSDLAQQINIDVQPPTVQDGRKVDVLLDHRDVTWDIRTHEVDIHVSQVSAYAGVRQAMTSQQRRIGLRGNVVMVGRDIGTVVLPEADLKIYLDASVEERARRRFLEQSDRSGSQTYEAILSSLRRRDQIDSTRSIAPLKAADDAHLVMTDGVDADDVYQTILNLVETACQ